MAENRDFLETYKIIYKLPEIIHKERVDFNFFKMCREDYKFVVLCIYNEKKEFLLLRDMNKNIGWELIGGYVEKGEKIEDGINRIVLEETGLAVDELQPILFINNNFEYNKKVLSHRGIAFVAQTRGEIKAEPKNIKIMYTSVIPGIMAYQNTRVLKVAKEIISNKLFKPPYEEIESAKKFFLPYCLHRIFIKNLGKAASAKIKNRIIELISGAPQNILDASCGDDDFVFKLEKLYRPEICVANDISWRTISLMKNKREKSKVLFINHNILELPFKNKFDLVIFKNTLHHIPLSEQKELIKKLYGIAKQLIIVDVEDPEKSNFLAKAWHWYYVHFLGDRGGCHLTLPEFEKIIKNSVKNATINIGTINTIKGRYFYASLLNMNNQEEVEIKAKISALESKAIRGKLLRMGAVFDGRSREADTYFTAPHRDFIKTKECLRIREADNFSELTYKGPTTQSMKKKKQFWKLELNIPIQSPKKDIESLFQSLDFHKVSEVIKDREKFTLGGQTICLDQIKGLGCFIEIESAVEGRGNRERALKNNFDLLKSLGVGKKNIVTAPYRDLVIQSQKRRNKSN